MDDCSSEAIQHILQIHKSRSKICQEASVACPAASQTSSVPMPIRKGVGEMFESKGLFVLGCQTMPVVANGTSDWCALREAIYKLIAAIQ